VLGFTVTVGLFKRESVNGKQFIMGSVKMIFILSPPKDLICESETMDGSLQLKRPGQTEDAGVYTKS